MSAEPLPSPAEPVDPHPIAWLFEPWLAERRARADAVWSDPRRWVGFCYFGEGDPRLWVPLRRWGGRSSARWRVPNFAHPRAAPLGWAVAMAHVAAAVAGIFLLAVLFGRRW